MVWLGWVTFRSKSQARDIKRFLPHGVAKANRNDLGVRFYQGLKV